MQLPLKVRSKVVKLTAPRKLVFEDYILEPGNLKSGEVYAETIYTAISPGTELAAYRGDPPLRPGNIYPRLVGYCNIARVKAVGPAVMNYKPGDIVLNFQSHRSAFICSQDKLAAALPTDSDIEAASATYLYHLGYNALLKGSFTPGMNIAVVGLGTLGLTTVALAHQFGGNVFAFSNQESSRKLALELGAKAFPKRFDDIADKLNNYTHSVGIDLVVSTSNLWQDWKFALQLARRGATISVLGFPGRAQPSPDFNPIGSMYFYDKQLTLIACGFSPDLEAAPYDLRFTLKRNCRYLLNLILDGKLMPRKLISGVMSAEDIESAYRRLDAREEGAVTFILKWNNE